MPEYPPIPSWGPPVKMSRAERIRFDKVVQEIFEMLRKRASPTVAELP